MEFQSITEKMGHPQARLIPLSLWNHGLLFGNSLSEETIDLMQVADEQTLMARLRNSPYADASRQVIWLAIALSHPNLSDQSLLEISHLLALTEAKLFEVVCGLGKLSLCETLLTKHAASRQLHTIIAADDCMAFQWAAGGGHLEVMKRLLHHTPKTLKTRVGLALSFKTMLKANDYEAFKSAARYGHLDVIDYLIALAPTKVQDMIMAPHNESKDYDYYAYDAFRGAAENGHLEVMERLIELAPTNMIASSGYDAFRKAAAGGHLKVMERLLELAPTKVQESIKFNNYCIVEGVVERAESGYLNVFLRLMELIPTKEHENLLGKAFNTAAQSGRLQVMEDLLKLLPENWITEGYHAEWALNNAITSGHVNVIDRLMELAPTKVKHTISVTNKVFVRATERGHLNVLERLIAHTPRPMPIHLISMFNHEAFRKAVQYGHTPIINRFLLFPGEFAYAEMHEAEYGAQYVHPFVSTRLTALRARERDLEESNPNALFSIHDPEEAKLCFYIIRNLIRRNDPTVQDDIRFLLGIPGVRELIHTVVTPEGGANELLRLALRMGNQTAAELLLTIPAVNQLAIQNHYYQHEANGGLDLAALAEDRESSMHALSTGEKKRLQEAMDRYQPSVREKGVEHWMRVLRKELETRYKATPASIVLDNGKQQVLPLHWEDFQALSLSQTKQKGQKDSPYERALKAYYQNKEHAAWRYLSKPNPWMHENASYVNVNPQNLREKWSTFDEHQPLIAMLYLAARDEQTPPCDGFTLETRLEHFIDELAHIGRAHNWDQTRSMTDEAGEATREEEYDNLEGDRPSCFSGVKRRLFQSVLGHPLLRILTKENIDEEIRDFVREHFKRVIHDKNREALYQAWTNYLVTLDDKASNQLKILDISPEQQQAFIQALNKKYLSQLDSGFIMQIKNAFNLKNKHDAHALNFGHLGVEQLLEPKHDKSQPSEYVARSSELGMFTNSTTSSALEGEAEEAKEIKAKIPRK